MQEFNFMKAFLLLGELTADEKSAEENLKYDEKIIFATPGIIKPSNWDQLPVSERISRISKLKELC